MKALLAMAALAAVCAIAQEGPGKRPRPDARDSRERPERMMPPPPANFGNFLSKAVLSEDFGKAVALTDEQKARLKAELSGIETNCCELEAKIIAASRKQGELGKKVLDTPDMKADEMFALIEEIGRLRTEQAKASVRTLLVIRDTLTAEQREKAHSFIREQMKKRMLERRMGRIKFRPGHDEGDGPNGIGPGPGQGGEDSLPPPPKDEKE